jgi:hypothetical protein
MVCSEDQASSLVANGFLAVREGLAANGSAAAKVPLRQQERSGHVVQLFRKEIVAWTHIGEDIDTHSTPELEVISVLDPGR